MALQSFINWLVHCALPTWAETGFDSVHGRFEERLDKSGGLVDVPIRAMVQARQIYVFAHAAELNWFPSGLELAERAMHALRRDFLYEDHGLCSVYAINRQGRVVTPQRDSYTHAFILFALAWLYRQTGNETLLSTADRVIDFVDRRLTDNVNGGVRIAIPTESMEKRQNPMMHLLEAYIALEGAAPGRGYQQRALKILALFQQKIFSKLHGVIPEVFEDDWAINLDNIVLEPGHHFEWIWLINELEAVSNEQLGKYSLQLWSVVEKTIAANNLIFDELGGNGRPTKRSHRLWPHCEAIKAAATCHAKGDPNARVLADKYAEIIMTHFVDKPFSGGWIDRLGPDLSPLVDHVPASSLYHLMLAGAVASKTFELTPAKNGLSGK